MRCQLECFGIQISRFETKIQLKIEKFWNLPESSLKFLEKLEMLQNENSSYEFSYTIF